MNTLGKRMFFTDRVQRPDKKTDETTAAFLYYMREVKP